MEKIRSICQLHEVVGSLNNCSLTDILVTCIWMNPFQNIHKQNILLWVRRAVFISIASWLPWVMCCVCCHYLHLYKVLELWAFSFLVFSFIDVHIFLPLTWSCTLAPLVSCYLHTSHSWLCIFSFDSAMPASCHVLQPSCTLAAMECCCCYCLVSYQWKE